MDFSDAQEFELEKMRIQQNAEERKLSWIIIGGVFAVTMLVILLKGPERTIGEVVNRLEAMEKELKRQAKVRRMTDDRKTRTR